MARFLLSYDVTLLLLLFSDVSLTENLGKIKCIGTSECLNTAISAPLLRKAATLNVLLVAAKIEDDIKDEGALKAHVAKRLFSFQISRAIKKDPQMWGILLEEYEQFRLLEKNKASLEDLEDHFSHMMARLAKECFEVTDEKRLAVLDAVAKWLYFIDAIDDLDEDLAKNNFNPFSEYGAFSELKNTAYLWLGVHYGNFYRKVLPLNGGENTMAVNRILFYGLPETTIRILTARRDVL